MDEPTGIEEIPSVLAALRKLAPDRQLTLTEALDTAARQATWLLETFQITEPPVPCELVTELPRVIVIYDPDMPASGSSHWNGRNWIVALNAAEASTRRRFSLMHEFKHIIDHGRPPLLGQTRRTWGIHNRQDPAEQVADFFAGCLLVPKTLLKAAWMSGNRQPTSLARHFDVSVSAMLVRLHQVGLRGYERHGSDAPESSPGDERNPYFRGSRPHHAGPRNEEAAA